METFTAVQLSIPYWHMAVLTWLITLCHVTGKTKLALLFAYGFIFYWVYYKNSSLFQVTSPSGDLFTIVSFAGGFGILLLSIVAFCLHQE